MELVREILLAVERDLTSVGSNVHSIQIEGRSPDEISYHVLLLHGAGFVEAKVARPLRGGARYFITAMTWQGHELLDSIRDPEVWKRTKAAAVKAGGASIEFMWEIAKAYGKQVLKERLNLDI
jgi:hypothetical protein